MNISDFIKNKKNSGMFVIDLSENDLLHRIYDVKYKWAKRTYSSKVEVEDTIAPTGKAINHEIWADEKWEQRNVHRMLQMLRMLIYILPRNRFQ